MWVLLKLPRITLDTAYLYDPDMLEIQLVSAELNNRYGDPQKALTYLKKADRLQPNSVEIALLYADTYHLLGETVNEVNSLLQARQLDGTRLDTYRRLGELYFDIGEYEQAVEPLRIYLVYAEDTAPQYWAWVAACYTELGLEEQATEAFAKADAAAKADVEIEFLLGKFFMDHGEYTQALVYLKDVAQKRTHSPLYNFTLAKLYMMMDNCLSSIYYFDLAQFYAEEDDPELLPEVYFLRGQCHYDLGNLTSAPEDMEALLALQEAGFEIDEDWIYYAMDKLGLLPTETPTVTPTETLTPTMTATETVTPTITETEQNTLTPTRTPSPTRTSTPTKSLTPTRTPH